MTEYEKKTYSCYCLFDDCCLAKVKKMKQLKNYLKDFMPLLKLNTKKWLNLVCVNVNIVNQ